MAAQYAISRRCLLGAAGAAGAVAMAEGVRGAWAQAAKRIDQYGPELEKIISPSEPIQELAAGLGGELGPAEGPVWWKEGGYLLFSDIHANKRMKYTPGQGVSVFKEPTNRANGLTRDLQGRLVACEHDSRRVTRQELDGSITVIANNYQGRRLNRPNDVVVKSDGCIYFTDPWSLAAAAPEQWDLSFHGVYRVTPDLGTLTLLADDFTLPNGLAFSPDESVLYINDTRRGHIRAFNLLPSGTLAKQTDRVFADLRGPESGVPDGMKVDVAGNVYCGGAGGILHPRSARREARPHRARDAGDHQYRVRRRRLEDALFHRPHAARHGQGEDSRNSGAGCEKIVAVTAVAMRERSPGFRRSPRRRA